MQTITTPNGEKLVVLGITEYEKLVDQADIAAGHKAKAAIAAGEEVIPAQVANRIIDGENKVKVWRTYRRMTARDLATAAGVTPPYISEIEGDKKEGSVSVLKKIAAALRVDLDDLV